MITAGLVTSYTADLPTDGGVWGVSSTFCSRNRKGAQGHLPMRHAKVHDHARRESEWATGGNMNPPAREGGFTQGLVAVFFFFFFFPPSSLFFFFFFPFFSFFFFFSDIYSQGSEKVGEVARRSQAPPQTHCSRRNVPAKGLSGREAQN